MKPGKKRPRLLFVFFLVFACAPALAGAHATGVSYQSVIHGYTVDIGYSSPAPQVGESVIFDFRLRDKDGNDVPFSDVWARIDSESGTVFATGIYNAKFGGSRLSYVFPAEGNYTVYARYETDASSIVEGSFPISVVPSGQGTSFFSRAGSSLFALVALGIGFMLGFFFAEKKLWEKFGLKKKS